MKGELPNLRILYIRQRRPESNHSDLCAESAAGVAVDNLGCAKDAVIRLQGINFPFDSDTLTELAKRRLDHVAEALRGLDSVRFGVAGRTNAASSAAYNLDLWQRRAAASCR